MKRMTMPVLLIILLLSASGCGEGVNSTQGSGTTPQPQGTQVTTAVLKLSTSGTGTTIYGIDVTVNLPVGVTVKSAANPPEVDAGIVAASGVAPSDTIAAAVYTVATSTVPGKVRILIANATGFSTGEFCTINGAVAAGFSPHVTDFTLASFAASDQSGNVITGLTPTVTADIH